MKPFIRLILLLLIPFAVQAQKGFYIEPFYQAHLANQTSSGPTVPEILMDYKEYLGGESLNYKIHPPKSTQKSGFGVTVGYGFGSFQIFTGLMVKKIGYIVNYDPTPTRDYTVNISYLDVPLGVGITPKITDNFSIHFAVAGVLNFLTNSSDNYFDTYKNHTNPYSDINPLRRHTNFIFGAELQAGGIFKITSQMGISLDMVYNRDLMDAENKSDTYKPNDLSTHGANVPVYTPGRPAQFNYLYGARLGIRWQLGH